MYRIIFLTKGMATRQTFVDTNIEFSARKTVATRKDFDLVVSCDALEPEEAMLIRDGWTLESDWHWSRAVNSSSVHITVNRSQDLGWDVSVRRNGYTAGASHEGLSLEVAVAKARRLLDDCKQLAEQELALA